MKIQEIIDKLCSHEISKEEAIKNISKLVNGLRVNNPLSFSILSVSRSSENDHGYLTLIMPYQYEKISKHFYVGDNVDVVPIP